MGLTCHTVSLDDVVHPCSQFMHDWMHGVFAKGVFNIVSHQLLASLEASEVNARLGGGATGLYASLFVY